jgi:hypothetical protein
MSTALFAAGLSSLSLSIMVLFDRLMMGDCYKNKPDQAWFVSSVAGSVFGLLATLAMWLGYTAWTDTTMHDIVVALGSLTAVEMIMMMLAGACNVQVLHHYFRLFIPSSKDEEVNETAIAMWLASSPIFIFATTILLSILGLNRGVLSGLEDAELTISFGIAVIVTVGAMVGFETYKNHVSNLFKRYGEVLKMLTMIVVYTLIISGILRDSEMTDVMALAIQPFFWIGFAAGMRTMWIKQNRVDLARNWPRIKKFVVPIITVEVIGMSVYFFEFFALKGADPTFVNLIIGAHIVPVFLFVWALSRLRRRMEKNNIRRIYLLGLRLAANKLPNDSPDIGKFIWFALVLGALSATTMLM